MRKLLCCTATFSLIVGWLVCNAPADEPPLREIFVPFADLHVILAADAQRVFMSREEYESLAARAKQAAAPTDKKQPATVLSADYMATIEGNHARLLGTLVVIAPDDNVNAVELDLSGVALRSATLDDKPAALGCHPAGLPVLFVRGAGRHELKLEILAPLETATAQRTLSFQIPTPPATRLRLTVAGHVEIKSGATVINRTEINDAGDETKPETHFDLLPQRGQNSLVLSLNNRQLQKEQVVVAHAVLVDEITSAYERLHATVSMSVLHGGAEQFRFAVPNGFEITSVTAPEVSRWAVIAEVGKRVLEVQLREPATGTLSLGIVAIRTPTTLEDWHSPKLVALDVAGQATVVGLLVENRLKPSALLPKDLISIDASVLAQTLPESLAENQVGTQALTAVAAFYAPQVDYELTAQFAAPAAELRALTNVLVTLADKSLSARGGFVLSNMTDKLIGFDFTAPADWQVIDVTPEGGAPLPLETYPADGGGTRIHVRLPQAAAIGQSQTIYFRATSVPEGWLDGWQTKALAFPVFQVVGTSRDVGAIAVQSRDDMIPRAEQIDRLTPLDANEKSKYGLDDVPTELAYRYDAPPYTLNLSIARVSPRLTARALSFFRVEPDLLTVHDELVYDVTEARTSRLAFALPAETPAEVAIRGLDGVAIKESTSELVEGQRRWTVQLAEPRRGAIRLAVDFQQPLSDQAADVALPLVRALDVAYQSGTVAVEGSIEQEAQVKTALRKVDVGELAEAEYQPGKRLLGAFGYVGEAAEVKLSVTRPVGHELPSAIVERAELLTMISASGRAQTAARFQLRAKAQMIEVKLPAGSTLWSAYLGGQPTLPQREAESLLINLPATAEAARRDLQLVYETPVSTLGMSSNVDLTAPQLLLRGDGRKSGDDVPLADLVWQLSTPNGFRVVRSDGTVYAEGNALRPSPLWVAVRTVGSVFAPVQAAREAGRRTILVDQASSVDRREFSESPKFASEQNYSNLKPQTKEDYDQPDNVAAATDVEESGSRAAPLDHFTVGETPIEPADFSGLTTAAGGPFPKSTANLNIPFSANSFSLAQSQWALEGLRSLPIELQGSDVQSTFQSLGESPRLSVTVVDRRRFTLLAWAVALLVFLRGVQLTWRSRGERCLYLLIVMVVALALPLALPWSDTLAPLCDMAFFAACWLVPYYLAAAVLKRLGGFGRRAALNFRRPQAATVAVALLVLLVTQHGLAKEPLPPVKVPADAIIVPYDPEKEDPLKALDAEPNAPFASDKSRKILVPYAKFLELRKATQADGKPLAFPPAEYALAGATFTTQLDGGESLVVAGHLDIEVYVDHPVSIPLALGGGVLTKATVDGTIDAGIDHAPEIQQQAAALPDNAPLRLLVTGPGRKQVGLAIRFRLQKRGGWQIAHGRLPVAAAAAFTFEVAKTGTEVTLTGGVDRGTIETKRDNQVLETALAADGAFQVEWRAKAGAAPVDQSLTARSAVSLDVQEDGLRLVWRYELEFRRGQRESFTIDVPEGYLVEKVNGANVRGWRLAEADGKRRLEVTLLKAAHETESFSVDLSRRGAVGDELSEFTAPVLNIEGAAQQSGEVTIRRSPLLELRTEQTAGVSRADNTAANANTNVESEESPLGIRPYQSYRFATSPFTIKLSVRPVAARVSAELQTVLKISERQRTLESRIRIKVQDRPTYRLSIALPADWKLDRVIAPEPFEWIVQGDGVRRVLSLYFAVGQRQPFDIVLSGALGDYAVAKSVSLPRIEILDADEQPGSFEQSGEIVVQADPSLNIRAEELKNCETQLLSHASAWIAPAQLRLARLALRYRSPDYAAQIQLSLRKPSVHCETITNIRVTQRAIEETILLEFNIQEAGIRSLSFLLPESMRDARISAPMLRQKTIEPVAEDSAKRVRVRLELQDEVMDNLRVLVENDRLMTGDVYAAPIPTVETGQTDHRYVTLESAGRDEIVVAAKVGIDPLGQEQAEWRMLAGILGRGLTQAYLVHQNEPQPSLALKARDRAAVDTAGARIGLAKATLVVDASGAYRGEQLYRVDNNLEQYLEVQLPIGARLWTAHVTGEPVKPAAAKTVDLVRIPLVKTAPGDADYAVVLKYGGQLGSLSSLDNVDFPLVRTLNIHVELSQVELHLPPTHRWFDFGGTMRLVRDEGDLAADWLAYNTKQIGLAMQSINSSDGYSRARALNNLKTLQIESEELKRNAESYRSNEQLAEQVKSNSAIQKGLKTELQVEQGQAIDEFDNSAKLKVRFDAQRNSRASDVVNQAGQNFDDESNERSEQSPNNRETQGQAISDKWLAKNKLGKKTMRPAPAQDPFADPLPVVANQPAAQSAKPQSFGKIQRQGDDLTEVQQQSDRKQSSSKAPNQLRRYEERLQSQLELSNRSGALQPGQQAAPKGDTSLRGGMFLEAGGGLGGMGGGAMPARAPGPQQAKLRDKEKPAALASLDVDLHPRGIKYSFTTPRGDVHISARALSQSLFGRTVRLSLLAMGVFVIAVIARKATRGTTRLENLPAARN